MPGLKSCVHVAFVAFVLSCVSPVVDAQGFGGLLKEIKKDLKKQSPQGPEDVAVTENVANTEIAADALLQRPVVIVTCDLLQTARGVERFRYVAEVFFRNEVKECARNTGFMAGITGHQWNARYLSSVRSLGGAPNSALGFPHQDELESFAGLGGSPSSQSWFAQVARSKAEALRSESSRAPVLELAPMSFGSEVKAASRVTIFFNYLSEQNLLSDMDRRAKAILVTALNKEALDPELPAESVAITCADFATLLDGVSVANAVSLEPMFSACYTRPNDALTFGLAEQKAFSGSWRRAFVDRWTNTRGPFATARAQARAQAAALAARTAREKRVGDPVIKGYGLTTPREAFMAIRSSDRQVWNCTTDANLHTETCTGTIRAVSCRTYVEKGLVVDMRATIAEGFPVTKEGMVEKQECTLVRDAPDSTSQEFKQVSTITGKPVSTIVISFFEKRAERIQFATEGGGSEIEAGLTEKYGEPITSASGRRWEGPDAVMFVQGNDITLQSRAVVAAKAAFEQSLKDSVKRAEEEKKAQLRKDL